MFTEKDSNHEEPGMGELFIHMTELEQRRNY